MDTVAFSMCNPLGGGVAQWGEVFRRPEVLGNHNVQVLLIALDAINPFGIRHECWLATVDQVH